MPAFKDMPLSVLNLSPVNEGETPGESFAKSLELTQHAEKLGYNRLWVAEHHNMEGIASSATSVLLSYLAGGTSSIRLGSGGIMLPNHAPLAIAEQFGTLESLYPGRIDLGLGRAPGTDQTTAAALRRHVNSGEDFPARLEELQRYFQDPANMAIPPQVKAVPGAGLDIPIWLLGSSGFSAQLAGQLGLPYAFAGHFAAENMKAALQLYLDSFQPSEVLDEPYAMTGINVIAGETDEEADYLGTTMKQQFLSLIRNRPGKIQPPVEDMDALWTSQEKAMMARWDAGTIQGGPESVRQQLEDFSSSVPVHEIMISGSVYDQAKRLRSYELIKEVQKQSTATAASI